MLKRNMNKIYPIGIIIKNERKKYKNQTLRKLASELKVTENYLSEVENFKSFPSEKLLKKLSAFFELDFKNLKEITALSRLHMLSDKGISKDSYYTALLLLKGGAYITEDKINYNIPEKYKGVKNES